MAASSRRKGVVGEREVAKLWRDAGYFVRGLEGSGDHLIVLPGRAPGTLIEPEKLREALRLGLITLGWDEKMAEAEARALEAWLGARPPLHLEAKRHERIRLPEWAAQAEREAPPGTIPVVCWRRSRMEWRADLRLDALVELAS